MLQKIKKRWTSLKQGEAGRSMVEMLGVLAITGVLSIGGILAYNVAIQMWKEGETYDQISKTIMGSITGMLSNRYHTVPQPLVVDIHSVISAVDFNGHGAVDGLPYAEARGISSFTAPTNVPVWVRMEKPEAFTVRMSGLNKKMCETLVGMHSGYAYAYVVTDTEYYDLDETYPYEDLIRDEALREELCAQVDSENLSRPLAQQPEYLEADLDAIFNELPTLVLYYYDTGISSGSGCTACGDDNECPNCYGCVAGCCVFQSDDPDCEDLPIPPQPPLACNEMDCAPTQVEGVYYRCHDCVIVDGVKQCVKKSKENPSTPAACYGDDNTVDGTCNGKGGVIVSGGACCSLDSLKITAYGFRNAEATTSELMSDCCQAAVGGTVRGGECCVGGRTYGTDYDEITENCCQAIGGAYTNPYGAPSCCQKNGSQVTPFIHNAVKEWNGYDTPGTLSEDCCAAAGGSFHLSKKLCCSGGYAWGTNGFDAENTDCFCLANPEAKECRKLCGDWCVDNPDDADCAECLDCEKHATTRYCYCRANPEQCATPARCLAENPPEECDCDLTTDERCWRAYCEKYPTDTICIGYVIVGECDEGEVGSEECCKLAGGTWYGGSVPVCCQGYGDLSLPENHKYSEVSPKCCANQGGVYRPQDGKGSCCAAGDPGRACCDENNGTTVNKQTGAVDPSGTDSNLFACCAGMVDQKTGNREPYCCWHDGVVAQTFSNAACCDGANDKLTGTLNDMCCSTFGDVRNKYTLTDNGACCSTLSASSYGVIAKTTQKLSACCEAFGYQWVDSTSTCCNGSEDIDAGEASFNCCVGLAEAAGYDANLVTFDQTTGTCCAGSIDMKTGEPTPECCATICQYKLASDSDATCSWTTPSDREGKACVYCFEDKTSSGDGSDGGLTEDKERSVGGNVLM